MIVDRREHVRYLAGHLVATLRLSASSPQSAAGEVAVRPLDFNRRSMGFLSPVRFPEGQNILANLRLDKLKASDIPGEVRSCRPLGDGFRCGVVFEFPNESSKMLLLRHMLDAIELRIANFDRTAEQLRQA